MQMSFYTSPAFHHRNFEKLLRKETHPLEVGPQEGGGHLQRLGPPSPRRGPRSPIQINPRKGHSTRGSRTVIKVLNKSRSCCDQRDSFYLKTVNQTSLGRERLRPSCPLGLPAWAAGPPKIHSKVITLKQGRPQESLQHTGHIRHPPLEQDDCTL